MNNGSGFCLRTQLAKLAAHHGVEPASAVRIPLAPPSEGDVVVEGLASAPGPDLTRMSFRPGALSWDGDCRDIPLLISHDRDRVAGEILELRHTANGLWIKAIVRDPEARRLGAFSISGTVNSYTLRNETRHDYFAEVTASTLNEISMLQDPACPSALVLKRYAVPADIKAFEAWRKSVNRRYDLEIAAVNCIARAVAQLANVSMICERPAVDLTKIAAGQPLIYGRIPPRPTRARQTDFSRLVGELSQREA